MFLHCLGSETFTIVCGITSILVILTEKIKTTVQVSVVAGLNVLLSFLHFLLDRKQNNDLNRIQRNVQTSEINK